MQPNKRGRPLRLVVELNGKVAAQLQAVRGEGGAINNDLVIATGYGVVTHHDRSLLKEYGGSLELTRGWSESLLHRYGYVMRKATKEGRKLPDNFEQLKAEFLTRIADLAKQYSIPDDLIINFDQTGVNLVPSPEWTMEVKGVKQVPVTGISDKHQDTLVLSVDMAGGVLPPQIIYQGKTSQCHPKFPFPAEWNINHSPNHWSNTETMLTYAEEVLIPHVKQTRERLDLSPSQPACVVLDVFAAHRTTVFLDKLRSNHIHPVFVPASCTGDLQPLDMSAMVHSRRLSITSLRDGMQTK